MTGWKFSRAMKRRYYRSPRWSADCDNVRALAIHGGGEMQKSKALTLQVAGTFALAMLIGTSAFAESRHLGGTRSGGSSRGSGSFSRGSGSSSRGSGSFSRGSGNFSRGSGNFSRGSTNRGRSAPSYNRSYSAPRSYSGSRSYRSAPRGSYGRSTPSYRGGNFYNNGSRFYGRGRIDRVVPYRGGYHVFLGGRGYPFFVPYRYYDPFRFRLGLFIGFNAFYDLLGHYKVYGWSS